ncbi:MAG TPA: ABC transporter substrate-binding protein [Clostridium sp.]|jgi:iron complex transport system substrate-binding protein|nr:ABC transporter substrate-binding protein [Clostridium sp.]
MKCKKKAALMLCIFMLVVVFVGCAKTDENPPKDTSKERITVTDMMGREIILEEPATRIVALTPSDCEILYAIGAGEALVGRGEYCDFPPEVLDVPEVQTGANTNLEQIIALKPQVVLMGTMGQTKEQVEALEGAGIKVVASQATDIEGIYASVHIIGKLMNKEEEAQDVINSMKETFKEASKKAEDIKGKTVYFEVSPLEYGLWTAGNDTFMNEVAEIIGLENCFVEIDGWGEISEEQVLERNPDYIVTIAMYFGEGPTPEEEIVSRTGWEDVAAVKNKAILNLRNNELSRPVPRLAEGAKMLYDFVNSLEE